MFRIRNAAVYPERVSTAPPNRIRELREARRASGAAMYTQAGLARQIGVDPDTVRKWETGAQQPRRRMARKIAKALGVDVEELWRPPGDTEVPAGGAAGETAAPD